MLMLVSISVSISVYFLLSISNQVTDETEFFRSRNRIFTTDTILGRIIEPTEGGLTTRVFTIFPGNLLLQLNGKPIVDSYELEAELSRFKSGDDVLVWVSDKFNRVANEVIVQASSLNDSTLSSFENALVVMDVEEGGVADRAGIKKGDIVVAINDISIKADVKSQNILENLSPGSIAKYDIIRYDTRMEINVRLAKYGISLISFLIFLFAMLCYFIGGFIGLKRPSIKAARFASLAIIGIGNLIIVQQDFSPDESIASSLMGFYLVLSLFYVPPLLLHSTYYFPEQNKKITSKSWPIWIPYVMGVATLVILGATIASSEEESLNLYLNIVFGFTVIMMLFGVWVHITHRRDTRPNSTARTLKSAVIIVPVLFILTQYFSTDYGELNRLFVLILVLIPVVFLYTVLKSRLIEVDFKIRKNIQYGVIYLFIVMMAISASIGAVFMISQLELKIPNLHVSGYEIEIIENELSAEKTVFWTRLIVTLLSITAVFIIYRAYRAIYAYMQKFFYRTYLDKARVGDEIAKIVTGDIDNFLERLPQKISEILQTYSAGVLVFEGPVLSGQHLFTHGLDKQKFASLNWRDIIDIADEFESAFRTEFLPESANILKMNFPFSGPVRVNRKMVALILIGRKLSDSKFKENDIDLVDAIARQTAVIWEKQELYQEVANRERVHQEIELARLIQKSSLPTKMPSVSGLDIAASSIPAYEVGGDFYEFYVNEGRLSTVIGDVSGKGTTAAMYMSKAQGMISALNEFEAGPSDFLKKFNKLLEPYMGKGDYLTALSVRFDPLTKTAEYARAGHIPMMHYSASENKITSYASKGMGIGFQGENLFNRNLEKLYIPFESGDVFLLLSDGVIEARNERGEEFGEERLEQLLLFHNPGSAQAIKESIMGSIDNFTNSRAQFDDFTLCVVKVEDISLNMDNNE